MKPTTYVLFENLIKKEDLKPTIIFLSSAILLTIHRYFGSMEFLESVYSSATGFEQSVFMFATAFLLMGLIPSILIIHVFREPFSDFGITLGDWKFGLVATMFLFPLIAVLMLFPASQTSEMIAFYPLDKSAGDSVLNFLRYQVLRGLLFYTAWEFFFRGFMLFGLRRIVGSWLAICIQTIPSCLWHIGMPSGEIFASIAGGILFGVIAIRTGSIIWPLLIHFLIGVALDLFIVITV